MPDDAAIVPGYPIDQYLQSQDGANWSNETFTSYRRILYELQRYLGGQPPDAESLHRWQRDLQNHGYSQTSINIRLSAANRYFRWCGRYDLLMHHGRTEAAPAPELTRNEYLRLLRAARKLGEHQIYLIVKLFAVTGLPLQCLGQITPQIVEEGGAVLPCRTARYDFRLPEVLQRELLDYIRESHRRTGPVFVSRNGRPINRSNLCRKLQELCHAAGVPEEKGSPRCLRNLYRTTQEALYARLEQQVQQIYDMLLQAEQESAGWQGGV